MGNASPLITRKDLVALTKKARGDRRQQDIAEEFGVSQTSISKAENNPKASLDELRIRIIERYLDIQIEGPIPAYRVVERF